MEQQIKGGGSHVAAEGGGHVADGTDGVKFFDLTSFLRGKDTADTVFHPCLTQFRADFPRKGIPEGLGNIGTADPGNIPFAPRSHGADHRKLFFNGTLQKGDFRWYIIYGVYDQIKRSTQKFLTLIRFEETRYWDIGSGGIYIFES